MRYGERTYLYLEKARMSTQKSSVIKNPYAVFSMQTVTVGLRIREHVLHLASSWSFPRSLKCWRLTNAACGKHVDH